MAMLNNQRVYLDVHPSYSKLLKKTIWYTGVACEFSNASSRLPGHVAGPTNMPIGMENHHGFLGILSWTLDG